MFAAEISKSPKSTNEIKAHECNNLASDNTVFSGVLSRRSFLLIRHKDDQANCITR